MLIKKKIRKKNSTKIKKCKIYLVSNLCNNRLNCEPMTIHDSIIESTANRKPVPNSRNVMVKLRLKRCGRKQRAT